MERFIAFSEDEFKRIPAGLAAAIVADAKTWDCNFVKSSGQELDDMLVIGRFLTVINRVLSNGEMR